jgi:hypothetical protein
MAISRRQSLGVVGLVAVVLFWLAVAGVIQAAITVVLIVLAVLILNRAQKKRIPDTV